MCHWLTGLPRIRKACLTLYINRFSTLKLVLARVKTNTIFDRSYGLLKGKVSKPFNVANYPVRCS